MWRQRHKRPQVPPRVAPPLLPWALQAPQRPGPRQPPHAAAMRVALCQIPVSSDPSVNLRRRAGRDRQRRPAGRPARRVPRRDASALRDRPAGSGGPARWRARVLVFSSGARPWSRRRGGVFSRPLDGRVCNTAVAIDATGRLVARYRKIHLFDALGQRESDLVAPGDELVIADLAGLRVGLLTCYDVRFPEQARALAAAAAQLLVIPAAWAAGLFKEEHRVTLVRARAIENTISFAAAGQVPYPAEPLMARPPESAAACSSIRWARSGRISAPPSASRWPILMPGCSPGSGPCCLAWTIAGRSCSARLPSRSADGPGPPASSLRLAERDLVGHKRCQVGPGSGR